MIKLRMFTWDDDPRLPWWALNPTISDQERGRGRWHAQKRRRQCDPGDKDQSDAAQAKGWSGHQKREDARISHWASEGSKALPTSWFWPSETDVKLLDSRILREWISVFSIHPIHGNLSQSKRIDFLQNQKWKTSVMWGNGERLLMSFLDKHRELSPQLGPFG